MNSNAIFFSDLFMQKNTNKNKQKIIFIKPNQIYRNNNENEQINENAIHVSANCCI